MVLGIHFSTSESATIMHLVEWFSIEEQVKSQRASSKIREWSNIFWGFAHLFLLFAQILISMLRSSSRKQDYPRLLWEGLDQDQVSEFSRGRAWASLSQVTSLSHSDANHSRYAPLSLEDSDDLYDVVCEVLREVHYLPWRKKVSQELRNSCSYDPEWLSRENSRKYHHGKVLMDSSESHDFSILRSFRDRISHVRCSGIRGGAYYFISFINGTSSIQSAPSFW